MSSIEFEVVQKNNKPRSIRFRNNDGTICLFDTGADYPVWCTGLQALYAQYPDSYKIDDDIGLIRGFGGNGTPAVVCCIPEFRLSDSKETLTIHNMCIAVCEKDFECDLILGYQLFNLSNVTITTFFS